MSTPTKYEGHTPGPWVQQNKYGIFALDTLGVVKNTICWTALNNNTRTTENEANARLIADAPELLAENTRLREALRAANVILLQQNKYSAADHEAMDVIQAALAAGKGTSPDLSADPAAYDRIADRELGLAAGKGEMK